MQPAKVKCIEANKSMWQNNRMPNGKRRGPGEGSISYRQAEGRHEGRYSVQTARGSKREVIYGKTYEECRAKLAQAIADRDRDLIFDAESMTVAEYMSRWIKGPAKKNIRSSTYARYEQHTRNHVVPALGRLKLKKLTAVHLEELYDAKLEEDLSPRTVNYIHTTISKALGYAVGRDLLRKNVASFADAPQPDSPEIQPLNGDQATKFLASTRGGRLEALYVLALSKGLRRSELLGLKEEDLDLEAATLQIRRGLTIAPGGGVALQTTKRKSSQRLLELSPETVGALKTHKSLRAKEQLLAPHWDEQGFLFTKRTGGHLHPQTLYTKYFLPARERASVPPIHFHDLRHTYATLALLNGVPVKVVSETLGHKDIATTLRTYAHVLPGMQKAADETMDQVLFSSE